jgi:hypothetical protein
MWTSEKWATRNRRLLVAFKIAGAGSKEVAPAANNSRLDIGIALNLAIQYYAIVNERRLLTRQSSRG